MIDEHVINLQDKALEDFDPKDTLYIRKMERGYSFHYLCQFISYKKGIVRAKVIKTMDHPYLNPRDIPKELTARPKNCYLWGMRQDRIDRWACCHWYKKDGWS